MSKEWDIGDTPLSVGYGSAYDYPAMRKKKEGKKKVKKRQKNAAKRGCQN